VVVSPDNAVEVVANVSDLLSNFSVGEQRPDNFILVTEIYEEIGGLIDEDQFNATVNVSGVLKQIELDHYVEINDNCL